MVSCGCGISYLSKFLSLKLCPFLKEKKKDREKFKCNCRQGNNKGMRLYKSYIFVKIIIIEMNPNGICCKLLHGI